MIVNPRNERLRRDIASCLQVTESFLPYVSTQTKDWQGGGAVEDRNVRDSLHTTLIHACNQLNSLIQQLGTYGTEETFEQKLLEGAQADINAKNEVAATARVTRRPSVMYQPSLGRTPGGHWCASYGDLSDDTTCVVGLGESVAEAMADFDRSWFEKNPPASDTTHSPKSNTNKSRKKKQ